MSKDPFQVLADEVTLIRGEIERLQRTSLDKDEAKALHGIVAKGVADVQEVSPALQQVLDTRLREAMHTIGHRATSAAHDAAERAVVQSHDASIKASEKLLEEAVRVRRLASRSFGHFWTWIALTAAVCLLVGSLATMVIQGRGDAKEFGALANIYCGAANGQRYTASNGLRYCSVPLDQ